MPRINTEFLRPDFITGTSETPQPLPPREGPAQRFSPHDDIAARISAQLAEAQSGGAAQRSGGERNIFDILGGVGTVLSSTSAGLRGDNDFIARQLEHRRRGELDTERLGLDKRTLAVREQALQEELRSRKAKEAALEKARAHAEELVSNPQGARKALLGMALSFMEGGNERAGIDTLDTILKMQGNDRLQKAITDYAGSIKDASPQEAALSLLGTGDKELIDTVKPILPSLFPDQSKQLQGLLNLQKTQAEIGLLRKRFEMAASPERFTVGQIASAINAMRIELDEALVTGTPEDADLARETLKNLQRALNAKIGGGLGAQPQPQPKSPGGKADKKPLAEIFGSK